MGRHARLTVLGSGTAVPLARRGTSCFLVEDGQGTSLLVDLGPGALQRAARAGCDLDALSAVLLTHLHPDHCADLVALLFALRNPLPRAGREPLAVLAHPDLGLLLARLCNAWPGWLAVGPERLAPCPVSPGPVACPGRIGVQAFRVAHTATSLGYRLTLSSGATVAFSGDATEGADLEELGRDTDLFVLECAAPDSSPMDGHLTPRRAGRVAAACGTRHLVLTHFYPPTLREPIRSRVQEAFAGPLSLAEDGMVLPIPIRAESQPPPSEA